MESQTMEAVAVVRHTHKLNAVALFISFTDAWRLTYGNFGGASACQVNCQQVCSCFITATRCEHLARSLKDCGLFDLNRVRLEEMNFLASGHVSAGTSYRFMSYDDWTTGFGNTALWRPESVSGFMGGRY
jgi:hypothetical protein